MSARWSPMHQRRTTTKTIGGITKTAARMKYVIEFRLMLKWVAMMSLPPAAQKSP